MSDIVCVMITSLVQDVSDAFNELLTELRYGQPSQYHYLASKSGPRLKRPDPNADCSGEWL